MRFSPSISGRPTGRKLDATAAGEWLKGWVAHRLGIEAEPVQLSWQIADLDLDSTEVLLLVTDVMHQLAIVISPGEVLAHRSLESLSVMLYERSATTAARVASHRMPCLLAHTA